jgi:DNA-binding GntR family transcriptional regulator
MTDPDTSLDRASLGFRSPAASRKLARSVYSGPILGELRSAIVRRRLPAGTRLIEERLASEFGVSRGPIRSALLALEAEGLVTSLKRGGMTVAGFGLADVSSLFSVRRLLEFSAVSWGIEADADPRGVVEALEEFRAQMSGSPASLVAADIAFHRSIVEFGQSRFLLQAWNSLAPVLEAAIAAGHEAAGSHVGATPDAIPYRTIFEAHVPLTDAIARGDAPETIRLLEQQFADAEENLRLYYADERPGDTGDGTGEATG